jgi:hypothetical protein
MPEKPKGYTKLKQWEKREAAFWHRLGYSDPGMVPARAGLINLRCSDIADTDLHFLLNRITHIDELDLKEALISNEGIKQLTVLKHIGILYLKDCPHIDNDCTPYLNQLITLRKLSFASTEVDYDGVAQLDKLNQLESLSFSTTETNHLDEQMQILSGQHPGCEFFVNGKRYVVAGMAS